jgi:dTMP kinase
MFLSLDGIDGGGKSTQIALLAEWLREQGHDVAACRDPGSTALGDRLRAILLDAADLAIGRRAEMFLYMAARAQLVDEVIRPALDRGQTVLCDRFLLANVVYQGHAGALDVETLWRIGETATTGLFPDLTIVLDLPREEAARRLRRPRDRMEQQGDDFLERVRQGYLAEAARRPDRMRVVDAARPVAVVQAEIRELTRATAAADKA